ncbi:MAG TPA: rhodanese-like domain-containing protein [Candidatus Binataceae bacterium]|nr:rhodanese-like domain-containing protein [Candidatus Binataceae bacterium]
MLSVHWQMLSALANLISTVAIVAGAIFVVAELRSAAKDRYLEVSNSMFEIWHSAEFQEDQLYLLHQVPVSSWTEFTANGRGTRAERAFLRVGGFYDRVGHLVLSKLLRQDQILPTISGDAIRVWQKIEPMVREARRSENLLLFSNYELMLPQCIECFVPMVEEHAQGATPAVEMIEPAELMKLMASREAAVIDVDQTEHPVRIAGAVRAEANDLAGWIRALPRAKEIVAYCSCPHEEASTYAAKQLTLAGLGRVRALRGGLNAWSAAHYPTERIDSRAEQRQAS